MWWRRSALYLCGMVRRDDQEGAGFLSHPVRGGNNGIRAPTQLTAHATQLEEMTVAARSAADSEVTRARTQIGEIEAEAVQHITEGITEAANRVMERRTARL